MRISQENKKYYGYEINKDGPDLVPLQTKTQPKKLLFEKLFPAQRDDDFLIVAKKDDVAVIDRFHGDLIDLSPQLQAKLLAFAHRSPVNDRVMRFWIERDR
jgi:hypothetical protein